MTKLSMLNAMDEISRAKGLLNIIISAANEDGIGQAAQSAIEYLNKARELLRQQKEEATEEPPQLSSADAQKQLLAGLKGVTALPEGSSERAEKLKGLTQRKELHGTIRGIVEQERLDAFRNAFDENDTIITSLKGLHHALDKLAWDDFDSCEPHCTSLSTMIKLLGSEIEKLDEGRRAEWKAAVA